MVVLFSSQTSPCFIWLERTLQWSAANALVQKSVFVYLCIFVFVYLFTGYTGLFRGVKQLHSKMYWSTYCVSLCFTAIERIISVFTALVTFSEVKYKYSAP